MEEEEQYGCEMERGSIIVSARIEEKRGEKNEGLRTFNFGERREEGWKLLCRMKWGETLMPAYPCIRNRSARASDESGRGEGIAVVVPR